MSKAYTLGIPLTDIEIRVYEMRIIAEMDYQTIAERLNVSKSKVKSLVRKRN